MAIEALRLGLNTVESNQLGPGPGAHRLEYWSLVFAIRIHSASVHQASFPRSRYWDTAIRRYRDTRTRRYQDTRKFHSSLMQTSQNNKLPERFATELAIIRHLDGQTGDQPLQQDSTTARRNQFARNLWSSLRRGWVLLATAEWLSSRMGYTFCIGDPEVKVLLVKRASLARPNPQLELTCRQKLLSKYVAKR
jgi:hypothetical protein